MNKQNYDCCQTYTQYLEVLTNVMIILNLQHCQVFISSEQKAYGELVG